MWMIVVGPEVVGPFDTENAANEWAQAFVDDKPDYNGYLQPQRWYIASLTDPRAYELKLDPSASESPWLSAS